MKTLKYSVQLLLLKVLIQIKYVKYVLYKVQPSSILRFYITGHHKKIIWSLAGHNIRQIQSEMNIYT